VTIAKALEVYFLNQQNERLAKELRQKNEELGRTNQNLEEMVSERTNDILFQNKVLQFAQNVLHCLPAAVLGVDPEGLIVQSNRMANQIFAATGASLTGQKMNAALPDDICSFIRPIIGDGIMSIRMEINQRTYLVYGVAMNNLGSQQGKILFLVPV
jgi:two-component system NtrC family sensor kinase